MKETTLKQLQVWIAILAGTVTFIVGAYQAKNIFFPKKDLQVKEIQSNAPATTTSPIRNAVEDVGAQWIKKWGSVKP